MKINLLPSTLPLFLPLSSPPPPHSLSNKRAPGVEAHEETQATVGQAAFSQGWRPGADVGPSKLEAGNDEIRAVDDQIDERLVVLVKLAVRRAVAVSILHALAHRVQRVADGHILALARHKLAGKALAAHAVAVAALENGVGVLRGVRPGEARIGAAVGRRAALAARAVRRARVRAGSAVAAAFSRAVHAVRVAPAALIGRKRAQEAALRVPARAALPVARAPVRPARLALREKKKKKRRRRRRRKKKKKKEEKV